MSETYFVGQRITLTGTFEDAAGAAFDPTTLEFTVREPNGVITEYSEGHADVTNPSVGTWKLSYLISRAGHHNVSIRSTTSGEEAVQETKFIALETV